MARAAMRFAVMVTGLVGGAATGIAASLPLPALPDAPQKALVLQHCTICHDLAWIQRSGGTEQGWNDRIRRMIRAGAMFPREQVPELAAYLAKALPERPRPALVD